MQVILAGSLMFDIVDRLTGLYMSVDHGIDNQTGYNKNPFKVLADTPGLLLVVNLIFFIICSILLIKFMRCVFANEYRQLCRCGCVLGCDGALISPVW